MITWRGFLFATVVVLIVALIYPSSPWLNYAVYPISRLEERIGPSFQRDSTPDCQPFSIAAHRGNFQRGIYEQNSVASIEAALNEGFKKIEVDLTVLNDAVILDHEADDLPPRSGVKEYESRKRKMFSMQEFQRQYGHRFETVIYDIKTIYATRERALELLLEGQLRPQKDIWIGRKCNLLRDLQRYTGMPAGCEAHGVVANWILGLKIWSIDFRSIKSFQVSLNRIFGLHPVLWSFPTAADAQAYCELNPKIVLIDAALN